MPSHYRWSRCRHQTARQSMPEASRYPWCPSPADHRPRTSICQLPQLSCILDSRTISASYEVSQAQKDILLIPRIAKVPVRPLKNLLGRPLFARLLFLTLWGPKKGLLCHTCTWFVTRKAPCYLAVTWERRRTKILKGLCGVIGWFQVAA